MNYDVVPNNVKTTIYSNGITKHYTLTGEQHALYTKLKDINRVNYLNSYVSSFLGFLSVGICLILLLFEHTREYAFIALCVIIPLWFSYIYYLTMEGKKNADNMDALLNH